MILLTGGAGYIGSHTAVALLAMGLDVVILDNFSNSKKSVIGRIREISGKAPILAEADMRDKNGVEDVFSSHDVDSVIHFAGLKAVGESVEKPLKYYDNNIVGTLNLLEVMRGHGVKKLIFSSSATVYDGACSSPFNEESLLGASNPYGWTKFMIERILKDLAESDPGWSVALLRYFNPIGAHESGLIGEDPQGIPNNLLPYVAKVASGEFPFIRVYGDDYGTPDGTGVRDYIHVMDLAEGHIRALEYIGGRNGVFTFNLGTGRGYSVLEVISAFERACGRELPKRVEPRRPGDCAVVYADVGLAKAELGFEAIHDLDRMCADSWRWQQNAKNP